MKLGLLLFFGLCLSSINSFVFSKNNIKPRDVSLKTFESIDFATQSYDIYVMKNKLKLLLKMIRPVNIIPTTLLCFAGGFITNPYKILSKHFFASTAITIIIMSNSMIINDIFDMKTDKINNPSRPLVTGEIKKKEAFSFYLLLLMISEILNVKYINNSAKYITHVANVITLIYTPILKRIAYIKNIACAGLISCSVYFPGVSIQPNFIINKNNILLTILSSCIFIGSFVNEVLFDIRDKDGDKKNNIITIPLIHGNEYSVNLVRNILMQVLAINAILLTKFYSIGTGLAFLFINLPYLDNIELIKKKDYSIESIKHTVTLSMKPLFLIVLYMCILSVL